MLRFRDEPTINVLDNDHVLKHPGEALPNLAQPYYPGIAIGLTMPCGECTLPESTLSRRRSEATCLRRSQREIGSGILALVVWIALEMPHSATASAFIGMRRNEVSKRDCKSRLFGAVAVAVVSRHIHFWRVWLLSRRV